ncbi:MAG: RNA-guided pseudouridylation complex pseudouridine synthase subunit Cbf5 [Candidatus Aenigmatarchaeota archaeon]|nr:RNA-guided pseudouridylation complex pseudouridine synthase subunit Cbf5 [Candidatus Aenigmarchaeota archaeon]
MRKFLIKKKEISDLKYGKYPGAQSTKELLENGIIIIDKPKGYTSHQIDSIIKKITGIKKCSHGGTLDPNVTGVLVIALGKATKLMQILLKEDKEYVGLIYLHKDIDEEKIKEVCKKFIGKIKQIPPVKSAVARIEREREIYNLEVLEIKQRHVLIKVSCEAGTYIRRLADDIGKSLGVGAHLQELRRIRSGIFSEKDAITLQEFIRIFSEYKEGNEEKLREILRPSEIIANAKPVIIVRDSAIGSICNGAPLYVAGISRVEENIKRGDIVIMLSGKGELVGFGYANLSTEEMIKETKGIAVKTDSVIMKIGTYPRKHL